MPAKKVKKVVYSTNIGIPFTGNKPNSRRKKNLKG